jgi:hypothetical protein
MVLAPAALTARSSNTTPIKVDITDQLKKLKELKDTGLLTDQEYETKRKELVGQL